MIQSQNKCKITVVGAGRWGSFLAWYAASIGHDVTLYGRASSKAMQDFIATRQNGIITLPYTVKLSTDIHSVEQGEVIIISVDSQGLRSLLGELSGLNISGKTFVLCMKGIEISSGCRLSEVAQQCLPVNCPVAVWVGPGHVQEFYAGVPNCMVIDSDNDEAKHRLVKILSSDLIRLYFGDDLIGSEIGAATKNVIGIGAGMLDAYNLSSLKGALMARGAREVARLIYAMGGNELSAYGLCHLGDYEATVFSKFSHNRQFGEAFIKGERFDSLSEGYYTAKALVALEEEYSVELPICHAIYRVLYENADPKQVLSSLFERTVKSEFYH